MTLIVRPAPLCLAVDSVEEFSDSALDALWAWGARGIFAYQGLRASAFARYLAKRFFVGFVGYSRSPGWVPSAATGAQDAKSVLDHVHGVLQVPAGVTIFDDVEEPSAAAGHEALIEHVDGHAAPVAAAHDVAGDYVGDSCGLTSEEWQARPNVHRYWQSCALIRDRFGKAVEPARGWCVVQGRPPNYRIGAAQVDVDFVKQDYCGASPTVVYDAATLLALGDPDDAQPPTTDRAPPLDPDAA